MWIDIVTLGICLLGGWIGWRRGSLAMALSLGALAVGYLAALVLFQPAGDLTASLLPVSGIAASIVGGVLAFSLGSSLVHLVGRTPRARRRARIEGGWQPPTPDRVGGAVMGTLAGGMVALVGVWALTSLYALRDGQSLAVGPGLAESEGGVGTAERRTPGEVDTVTVPDALAPVVPDPVVSAPRPRSLAQRLGERLAEEAVTSALRVTGSDPRTAATAGAAVARPQEARRAMQTLLRPAWIASLAADPSLRDAALAGDAATIAGHPRVRAILADPEARAALASLQIVESPSVTAEQASSQLADYFAPMGRVMEQLRADPDFVQRVRRARVQERLAAGEVAGLLNDPDVEWMIARARAALAAQHQSGGR